MEMTTIRQVNRTVIYTGHVQGVGFRYTARSIAGRYAVTGYVKNLADGRVELVAEGESRELDEFLREVRVALSNHIREEKCDVQAASGGFRGFEIRR
jgi:acylphosphatase